jgi:hypothetical protein
MFELKIMLCSRPDDVWEEDAVNSAVSENECTQFNIFVEKVQRGIIAPLSLHDNGIIKILRTTTLLVRMRQFQGIWIRDEPCPSNKGSSGRRVMKWIKLGVGVELSE